MSFVYPILYPLFERSCGFHRRRLAIRVAGAARAASQWWEGEKVRSQNSAWCISEILGARVFLVSFLPCELDQANRPSLCKF